MKHSFSSVLSIGTSLRLPLFLPIYRQTLQAIDEKFFREMEEILIY